MGHGTHLRNHELRRPRQHPNHIDESPLPDASGRGRGWGRAFGRAKARPCLRCGLVSRGQPPSVSPSGWVEERTRLRFCVPPIRTNTPYPSVPSLQLYALGGKSSPQPQNSLTTTTSLPSQTCWGGAGGGVVTRAIHRIAPTDFAWMGHGTHLRNHELRRAPQHPNHIDESPLPDASGRGRGWGCDAGDSQNRPYGFRVDGAWDASAQTPAAPRTPTSQSHRRVSPPRCFGEGPGVGL